MSGTVSTMLHKTMNVSGCDHFVVSYAGLRYFLEHCLNTTNVTQGLLNQVFDEEYKAAVDDKKLPFPMLFGTILIFTIMILFGALGSSLVIFVVLRKRSMRTRSNLFIMNLAISDLTLCLFTQPFTLYRLLIGHNPWILGSFMCKFSAMFQGTNIFVSTISITAIALDRFQCIVHPSVRPLNTRFTIRLLYLAWLIAFVLASPLAFFSSVVQMDVLQCTERAEDIMIQKWKITYSIAALLFQYLLPLVIVISVYSRICRKIRQRWLRERNRPQVVLMVLQEHDVHMSTTDNNQPSPSSSKDSKTIYFRERSFIGDVHKTVQYRNSSSKENRNHKRPIILLTGIGIIFALSWLPLNVVNVWMDIHEYVMTSRLLQSLKKLPTESNMQLNTLVVSSRENLSDAFHSTLLNSLDKGNDLHQFGFTVILIQTVCLTLVFSSSCLNPILYGWLNVNFRKEFHRLLFKQSQYEGRCTVRDSSRSQMDRRMKPSIEYDRPNGNVSWRIDLPSEQTWTNIHSNRHHSNNSDGVT